MYDMFERQELQAAKAHVTEAETLVAEAREIEPKIRELPKFGIPLQ